MLHLFQFLYQISGMLRRKAQCKSDNLSLGVYMWLQHKVLVLNGRMIAHYYITKVCRAGQGRAGRAGRAE